MARVSDASQLDGARRAGGPATRDPARPGHRPVHLLGRPAGAGARELRADRGDHRRRRRRAHPRARAHRVREGLQPALAAGADRPGRRDRHGDRHAAGRQLVDGAASTRAREQRDRDDEHPRRLHGRRLAGAEVRLQELDSLLRVPSRTTRRSSPRTMARPHAPRTGLERDMVEAEEAVERLRRPKPGRHGRPCCAAPTSSARTSTRRSPGCSGCRWCRWCSASIPRLQFVHEDDVVHALEHAAFHRVPGVYNVAADGVLALSEIIDLRGQAGRCRSSRRGAPGLVTGPLRRLGFRIPDEVVNQLRFGRGVDNRLLQGDRVRLRVHDPRGRAQARRAHAAGAGDARAPSRRTPTSARWRSSCAGARTCAASTPASAAAWRRTASRSGSEPPDRRLAQAQPALRAGEAPEPACRAPTLSMVSVGRRAQIALAAALGLLLRRGGGGVRDRPGELGQDRRRRQGRRRRRRRHVHRPGHATACDAKLVKPLDKPVTVTFEGTKYVLSPDQLQRARRRQRHGRRRARRQPLRAASRPRVWRYTTGRLGRSRDHPADHLLLQGARRLRQARSPREIDRPAHGRDRQLRRPASLNSVPGKDGVSVLTRRAALSALRAAIESPHAPDRLGAGQAGRSRRSPPTSSPRSTRPTSRSTAATSSFACGRT